MRYILHLGLPKTGTKSLQNSIFPKLPGVSQSLLHDTPPGPAAHLEKVRYNSPNPIRDGEFQDDERHHLLGLRAAFLASAPAAQTCIVSTENVLGPHRDGIPAIIDRIGIICPEASILWVVREPLDFLRSIFRQGINNYVSTEVSEGRVPNATHASFSGYIRKCLPVSPVSAVAFVQYADIAARLRRIFGSEKTLILKYETLKNNPSAFLTSVLEFVAPNLQHDDLAIGHDNESARKLETILQMAASAGATAAYCDRLADVYTNATLEPALANALDAALRGQIEEFYPARRPS